MSLIEGRTGLWQLVMGLEIHAQVSSKSKLFSGASTEYGAQPNTQVSLVDAAMPGMLPVLNEYCISQAVKTGLGLNGKINKMSAFDRKNYFYPDLPQGYQISQFYYPIVEHGWLKIRKSDGTVKTIRIGRLHLEQDAGKSIHDQVPDRTLIDLNRCGVALMEIVSEPDMNSIEEVTEYVKAVRSILRYCGTCDGDMEKGSMRCDVNVSVCRPGQEFGTRCEIKNVNSIKNIAKAIEFEARRQIELLESGQSIIQETRLFDANSLETKSMRSKEDSTDYRYFADPDLPPLILTDEYIESIRSKMPELPEEKKIRYQEKFELSEYDASVLTQDQEIAFYFEEAATSSDAKLAANWIISELFALLKKHDIEISQCKIKASDLKNMINLIKDGTISGKIAKTVFEKMFDTGKSPTDIIEEKGLVQINDEKQISSIIDDILLENPQEVESYKAGKHKLLGFFVGQCMKKTGGKANPGLVNKLLKEKLS